ncbi:hypothetical protein KFL_005480090 [Klebsormidium nitens]|uniref:DnaJ homologue subfamily C member 28 conserved domain-containing protein n=1 Tax=Klebsormidium nitens TaxID=105231 RepID=A0A1Y1IFM3_KLENI|nr:hypothetical protein KFL_005480090 [Klebsormidium nitens]|eukprot:GAQ89665.1 hypothetical protein KFL_005480090 [Klebsormidium nitens]
MDRLATRGRLLWDCGQAFLRRRPEGLLRILGRFEGRCFEKVGTGPVLDHSNEQLRGEEAKKASHTGSLITSPPLGFLPIENFLLQTSALLQQTQNTQHCLDPSLFSRALHSNSEPREIGTGQPARDSSQKKSKKGGHQETLERLQKVKWALYERRLPPELRNRDDIIKSEAELVGVVEQRIQQSMREGDFDKLPGHGKPLEAQKNPHIDAAEDLASRVLGNSGFAPEWVTLNKDIRQATSKWRAALKAAWLRKRGTSAKEVETSWEDERPRLEAGLAEINRKILHYNLITPFGRQMMGRKMERELEWLRDELQSL